MSFQEMPTLDPEQYMPREATGHWVPALTILHHVVTSRIGDRFLWMDAQPDQVIPLSRATPTFSSEEGDQSPISDPGLSRTPLLLYRERNGIRLEQATSRTRVTLDGTPLVGARFIDERFLERGVVVNLGRRVILLLHRWSYFGNQVKHKFGLVGQSEPMHMMRENINRVADLDIPVLLLGETGTGKEMVAQAIHKTGPRSKGPFVAVNLGVLPPQLAASELFGAVKGAYTGADRDKTGFFQQADGGTLFLDEVGEATPEVQVSLLRALETGEVYPVGGRKALKPNIRVIAATDSNLNEMIDQKSFRAPLMHRLAGYELRLPPLRQRRDDIPRLFLHFLSREWSDLALSSPQGSPAQDANTLPIQLIEGLCTYRWPGNVRELRNVARQLAVFNRGSVEFRIDSRSAELLGCVAPAEPQIQSPPSPMPQPVAVNPPEPKPPRRKPSKISNEELATALEECLWDQSAASRSLGISRSSLYDLMQNRGYRFAVDLSHEELITSWNRCNGDLEAMAKDLQVSPSGIKRRLKETGLT